MSALTIAANLRHAAINGETVIIGGGEFGPAELLQAATILSRVPDIVAALRQCHSDLKRYAPCSAGSLMAAGVLIDPLGGL